MKKGLVISWYFPPINSSEGLCTFKLLKNSKFEYDVFTQNSNKSWSYDTNENKLVAKNINTIFSKTGNIEEWIKEGIEFGLKNIDNYDFIMSRSMAPESHEIALNLKRKNPKILWIASFGDPIADNPYLKLIDNESPHKIKGKGILNHSIKYIFSLKRIIKNIWWEYKNRRYNRKLTRNYKNELLQKKVLNECDVIIFNNEYQKEYMLINYSNEIKQKALVLPHGYDMDFYIENSQKYSDDFIHISYLGHLDDIRTPKNLLMALTRLKKTRKDLYEKLKIEIYGNMAPKDKVLLVDNDICDIVKFKKPVKYFESLEIMQKSDLLLLIDANLGNVLPSNIFYAAKLADYIGSKSNIFGVTMSQGPSADIIKEIGGVLSSHSIDDIYNNLVMVLENKIEINNNDKSGKYNMKNISRTFDSYVEEKMNSR